MKSNLIIIFAVIAAVLYAGIRQGWFNGEPKEKVEQVSQAPCPPCPDCPDISSYQEQIDYLTEQLAASRKENENLAAVARAAGQKRTSMKASTPEPSGLPDCLESLKIAQSDNELNDAVISAYESQVAGLSGEVARLEDQLFAKDEEHKKELAKQQARYDELIDQLAETPDLPDADPVLPDWALNPPESFKHGIGPALIWDGGPTSQYYGATYQYGNRFAIQATPAYNPTEKKFIGQVGVLYRFK